MIVVFPHADIDCTACGGQLPIPQGSSCNYVFLPNVANNVNVIPPPEPLPKLPVARAVWIPEPGLKIAATSWIFAGGAHHTGFSLSLRAQHLEDFAEMAGIEYLLIDIHTTVASFKKELWWNDAYFRFVRPS
jgi:L-arabinose isomerase